MLEDELMNYELKLRVQQGSVLGPTLFTLTFKKNCEIISYADNIVMVAGVNNNSEVQDIDVSIVKLFNTVISFGLNFNNQNVFGLLISKNKKKKKLKITYKPYLRTFDENIITFCDYRKYLRIILDQILNFNEQINMTINKIVKHNHSFSAFYSNNKNRLILYKVILISYVRYYSLACVSNLTTV